MTIGWTEDELRHIDAADELFVAARRTDGTLRREVPVWVVRVGEQVFVRTWHRRETGWFGSAVDSLRAHIRVLGLAADVAVSDVGPTESRTEIDAAYRAKYGRYGASVDQMVTDTAAGTTLRLSPDSPVDRVGSGAGQAPTRP